jgi:hypothetical protein
VGGPIQKGARLVTDHVTFTWYKYETQYGEINFPYTGHDRWMLDIQNRSYKKIPVNQIPLEIYLSIPINRNRPFHVWHLEPVSFLTVEFAYLPEEQFMTIFHKIY